VFGPTKYIKGVHTQCEHVINVKCCNKHHLRRDCKEFQELQRLARDGRDGDGGGREGHRLVHLRCHRTGECSPSDYEDGTSAYSFDLPVVEPTVEVAADGEFGFNKFVEALIAGADEERAPVFEALTPTPPAVDAPSPAPAPWSVETMPNLAALLLVLSLGCSMLVPQEPG
jgi:hypothetical protein